MGKRIDWNDLTDRTADALAGRRIEIEGYPVFADTRRDYAALTEEPGCCLPCLPADPARRMEILAAAPLPETEGPLRIDGRLELLADDAAGWRYRLRDARALPRAHPQTEGFTRRRLMGTGMALGLSAWMPDALAAAPDSARIEAWRQELAQHATVDIHSHGGSVQMGRESGDARQFTALAEPMRQGGMAAICLAVVADRPVTELTADKRIRPVREPKPGELYDYIQQAFARAHRLAATQKFAFITDATLLEKARGNAPSVIISSEGADFLEGRIERLDEAHARWKLRHLQLTHYRPNELGDIQTEPPVHHGLTDFGAEVIARCNALGIVVDVAHGPFDFVQRAATVTKKPLVLSHTSLDERRSRYSRRITSDHARLIAKTGGVIGVWPPFAIYPDMAAFAAGMIEMAKAAGFEHVGLGTDMLGLVGSSVLPSYSKLPELAAALEAQQVSRDNILKLLGGNYRRVFAETLKA